jgi:hypothetical protein
VETIKPTIPVAVIATEHAEALAWIIANDGKSTFATSLHTRLKSLKNLTDGQLGAVQKILTKGAAPAPVPAEVSASGMAAVQTAFDSAIGSGIKRPKLRLATFLLSPAKAGGNNTGAIYANDAEQLDADHKPLYLGKIMAGKFIASKACMPDRREALLEACADPLKEAIAYGRRTGSCACCGRELTDSASIEQGIGPICLSKWFGG